MCINKNAIIPRFLGFYKILIFLCNINSIRKKDCLNYKEELRDGLCETPTTSDSR